MKRRSAVIISLLYGLAVFSTACEANVKQENVSASSAPSSGAAKEHFDYNQQSDWHITSGEMQSPVDIIVSRTEKMRDAGSITLNYNNKITRAENNGHSIEVTDSGTATINKRNFELIQFHFHSASEHTINGQHFPLEAHFVNKSQDGRIAVIGVLFTEGKNNVGFGEVLDDVNNDKNDPITDIQAMFPENKSYYHYLGSLTTPPLIENVEWYILKDPVEVSSAQIATFKKLYSHNNRQLQKLNDRVVLSYDE